MSEINLSSAVRSSLLTLQSTADLLATTQERLATGNKVNSALDDPTAFFTATALNDRAADLSTLLDEQGQAIQVVEAADDGITAIQDLVQTARAIATQALQTDSANDRAALAAQYDSILNQVEELANDASFNGTNLLDSLNSQSLQVVFNEDGSSNLNVQGVNFTDTSDINGLNLQRISSIGTGTPSTTGAITIESLDATSTLTIDADGVGGVAEAFQIDLSSLPIAGGTPNVPATLTTSGFNTSAVSDGDTITITGTNTAGAEVPATLTFRDSPSSPTDIDASLTGDALASAIQTAINTTFGPNNVTVGDAGGELALGSAIGNVSFAFNDADGDSTGASIATLTTAGGTDGIAFDSSGPVSAALDIPTSGAGSLDLTAITSGDVITIGVGSETVTVNFTSTPADADAAATVINDAITAATLTGNLTVTNNSGTLEIRSSTADVTFAFNDVDGTTVAQSVATQTTAGGAAPGSIEFEEGTPGSITQGSILAAINSAGAATGVSAVADGTDGFILSSTSGNVAVTNSGSSGAINVVASGFVAGTGNDFATNADINQTLLAIDSALGTLRTTAATFGTNLSTIQIRQDFTENLINTLEIGAGNLVLADLNEEGANLLTLQTRQQLASTSLSFATQADQAVLSLFG